MVPVSFAPLVSNMWTAVLLIGLAAAAHQGFSANMYTLASDMFPRRAVGSVIGIAGMAGAVGGILMQAASGRIKDVTGSYLTMFVIAGSVYVLSVLVIHALAPRLAPGRSAGRSGQSSTGGPSMADHGGTRRLAPPRGRRALRRRRRGRSASSRSPYRVCPLGAHIDHQLGPVTAMAIDQSVLLAYAPSPARRGPARAACDFPGDVRFSLDDVPPPAGRRLGRTSPGARRSPCGSGTGSTRGLVGVTTGRLHGGGVSSSAAVGVAFLLALRGRQRPARLARGEHRARTARIENDYLGLRNGILDQAAVLLSRRGHLTRIDCRTVGRTS